MAKAEKKEDEEGAKEEAGKKGSKKKLIIIIVVALVVLGGGVGAFFAMKGKGASDEAAVEEGAEAVEEEGAAEEGGHGGEGEALTGAIFPLETFIVNLGQKGSFLKTAIQLEFAQPELPESVEVSVPKIRDAVIRVLSSRQATDILSVEGKEKLREEIKAAVNQSLGTEDVVNVYFTEFIVQ